MKRNHTIVIALVIVATTFLTVGATPGSVSDPAVSKSYVDDKFNQLLTVLSAINDTSQPGVATQNVSYVPVSVKMGQLLIGLEGTEIILRSGKAVGYCTGENGMVNITTGTEVFSGTEIPRNHMLIVPRDDGRGALVVEDAWFLVKGGYSIQSR